MIAVDPYSLVAWDTSVNLGIPVWRLPDVFVFWRRLLSDNSHGPGRVVIQSMSFEN